MIRLPVLAALLALLPLPILAQPLGDEQIQITSDVFVVEEAASLATFTGNVVVLRQGLTVWADKVVVEYAEGGMSDIESFVATGGVRLKTADQDATGDRAVFDPDTEVLRLLGNVVVVNEAGTVNGPELTVNLADNTSVFTSDEGGRVTGIFVPQ